MSAITTGWWVYAIAVALVFGYLAGNHDRRRELVRVCEANTKLRAANKRLRDERLAYRTAVHAVTDELAASNPDFTPPDWERYERENGWTA